MPTVPVWNILLVDDDEDDYLLTKFMLDEMQGKKAHLDWVSNFEEGRRTLAGYCFDAVLMDYDLGVGSGLDLIREAVAHDYPAPFILLTGRGSYDVDVEAMKAGATLYLTKAEANPLLLERSIRYAIERKRIEQGVSHVLESIQDGFYALDKNWQITYINRKSAKPGGHQPDELVGRNFWECFPRLLGTMVEQKYRTAMRERQSLKFEMPGVYQSAWYNISIYPFEDGISVYWQDITERKQAEEALRSEEATLRGILNATKESIWLFDPDGLILMANETAVSRFSRPLEEIVGRHFSLFMPADVAQARQARLRETIETKHLVEFEDQRAGIFFHHNFYPVFDANGEVTSVAVFSRDITERKRVEETLEHRKEELEASKIEIENEKRRLEVVMKVLPVGLAITDARGGSIQANPAFEQVWGGAVRPAEAVADYVAYQAWWADTGKPIQPDEWASAQAVMKGEAVHGQILEIQRFDGKRAFVLNSGAPVRNSSGAIVGSAVAIQDITRLIQADTLNKALNEINQLLYSTLDFPQVMEQVITASCKALGCNTAALSLRKNGRWVVSCVHGFPQEVVGMQMNDDEERHALLSIQTQKPVAINDAFNDSRVNRVHMRQWGVRSVLVIPILLRQEAIGVMFFNYRNRAFEFQDVHILFGANLAASISLALENTRLFASLEDEIRQRKVVEAELNKNNAALRASEQRWATTLVNTQGHAFTSVDLNRVAGDVLEDLEYRLRQKGGRVEVGNLPVIQADPTQMHQLLQNLIGNALKFCKPGTAPSVRVLSRVLPDRWIEIDVEDDGIGLDMKEAERLFQPFQRLHPDAEIEGAGIGLSICRKIAERHGGKITVRSEPGKGTVFTVSLPVDH